MQKLRTIIVDDESLARKLLRALLSQNPMVEIVAECRNGREAVSSVQELEPDLMFLDIQMPETSGFDVVKELQSDLVPMVIFCTAYQRYALDAFDLHAVDYLLKPVDEQRLERAVQRAWKRAYACVPGESGSGENKTALLGAIDEIAKSVGSSSDSTIDDSTGAEQKIAIKDGDKTILINTSDIDWIDAAGDYMCVHVKGVTHVMRSTLKSLMSKLDPEKFKRIHRSTVVNLERIEQVTSQDKGEYTLFLDCNEQLKVSRNYRDGIKEFLSHK